MKSMIGFVSALALLFAVVSVASLPAMARSGGSGGGGGTGGGSVDTIKVSKCYYVTGNGTMLVNASSSNSSAHLSLYLPSGKYVGEVQNGGGGRYGGTVFYVGPDPVTVTIISSAGGSITVPTTPFQL